jgi:hypothetical protein
MVSWNTRTIILLALMPTVPDERTMKMMAVELEVIADNLLYSHDMPWVNLIWQNNYTNGKLPGATSNPKVSGAGTF